MDKTNETAAARRTVQDLVTIVPEGERTVFDLTEDVEAGKTLTIERQAMPPERAAPPRRQESPPRAHTFYAVRGFADWLLEYGSSNVVVYADAARGHFHATLDEGAREGFEVVRLEPQVHPRWAPWRQLVGRDLPLLELVKFLRDHRRAIHEPTGRELVLALSQISAKTEVQLERGTGSGSINGLLVKTTIKGNDKTDLVDLPEQLVLMTPIYVDTEAQRVEVDLTLDVQGDEVVGWLSSADMREAEIQAFDGMVEHLRKTTTEHEGKPWTITYGTPAHGAWRYLDRVG